MLANVGQINEPIDRAEQMLRWHMPLQVEAVEERLLRTVALHAFDECAENTVVDTGAGAEHHGAKIRVALQRIDRGADGAHPGTG